MLYFALSLLLVLMDQLLKFWVVDNIPLHEQIPFLPQIMDLTYVQNTGAAFSMLSGQTDILALTSFVMSCVLVYLLKINFFTHPLGKFGLALVLGGAVGNLLDRMFRGFVVDMFQLLFINFAIFNIADICVVVGGILGGFYYIFLYEKIQGKENPESVTTEEESS